MDKSAHDDLKLLVSRRWDPRVGMGKNQGRFEWALGVVLVIGFFVAVFTRSSATAWVQIFGIVLSYGTLFVLTLSWAYTRCFVKLRIEKRVNKHDGFLCVWCSYPFTGLGDDGHCPECGAGYRKELCQRLFGLAYRKYTPSPQEFGKRESAAWREAIELREHPELVQPTPPPVIKIVVDAPVFSPSKEQRYEIDQLVLRRTDPRKGVGRMLGSIKYFCLVLAISLFFIMNWGIIPANRLNGPGVFKWMLVYIVPFVGFLICWFIPIGIRKRTYAKARKHNFILCPWCRHGLSHLPEVGICPGCGSKFSRWACEQLYLNAYRGFRPSKDELRERETEGWTEAVRIRDQES